MSTPLPRVPTDRYAFGNTQRPRPPRIAGYNLEPGQKADIIPNEAGLLGPGTPGGASAFGDPSQAPIAGHYHVLPAGTELPEGLQVVADGADVGGPHSPTHHTVRPSRDMTPLEFLELYNGLPWQYGGKTS
jgi:hypothetical protein